MLPDVASASASVRAPAPEAEQRLSDHAMTRGLLLSAGEPPEEHVARLWAMATTSGWGLPYAWDAFSDGEPINPPETAYAVTTALVIQGFLDAGQSNKLLAAIAVSWARCFWSDKGFYWYSDQPQDAIYTPNTSALLAGLSLRLLVQRPRLFSPLEAALIRGRADDAVEHLVTTAGPGPTWRYTELNMKPNDLIHHAYTLWGAEVYRASGGRVRIPWDAEEAAGEMVERRDVGAWPAGAPAMRYAFAVRHAPSDADPADLEATPISERDAAHQTWARSLAPAEVFG